MYLNNFSEINLLVEKTQAGDNASFWKLFEFYQPIINSTVNRIHKQYKTIPIEDLYSECIFVLKGLCEKYNKEKSYFSYYINIRLQPYLIAKIKSTYLESLSIVSLSEVELKENFDEVSCDLHNYSSVQDEIDKLPDQLKKAIYLFYFEGLNQTQSADICGISQPAFNKQLKKAIKILKENLK